MARRSFALAPRPAAPVIVMAPQRRRSGGLRRAYHRAAPLARRAGRRVAKGAWNQKSALGIGLASGVLGYLDGSGKLDSLPEIGGSRALTLGIAGFLLTRWSGAQWAKQAGTAALAVGIYDYARARAK